MDNDSPLFSAFCFYFQVLVVNLISLYLVVLVGTFWGIVETFSNAVKNMPWHSERVCVNIMLYLLKLELYNEALDTLVVGMLKDIHICQTIWLVYHAIHFYRFNCDLEFWSRDKYLANSSVRISL